MTYLEQLRARYEAARLAVEAIQQRAADHDNGEGQPAGRTLTADEATELRTHVATCEQLAPQIEATVAQELRSRTVSAAAARVAQGQPANGSDTAEPGTPPAGTNAAGEGDQTRSAGNAQTRGRDPGHYRSLKDGGQRSFFSDLVRAKEGDSDAAARLVEHNRALSNASQGAGLVPPVWLTSEYEYLARQGRKLSAAVRQYPLGNDPRPITLPKQTAGTDSVVAAVSPENTHPSETNGYNTSTDVVTPAPISGIQVVSRQMIDMDDPAIDGLIYTDLMAVYNRKIEDLVCAAVLAASGAAVVTYASDATNFTATAAGDGITDAAFSLWNARKLPATVIAMRITRWGKFNKFRDSTGRKLYPLSDAGPMNVDGVGAVNAEGSIEGLPVIATDGLGTSGYAESIAVLRASDTILFEGNMMRFRYEEVAGPESIKLGIWAYSAVIVRQNANSVRKLTISAA